MRRSLGACVVLLALSGQAQAAVTPSLHASLSPGAPLFADAFAYVVTVEAPSSVDPAEIRIRASTGPFAVVAAPVTRRSSRAGDAVRVELVQTLACLSVECLPGEGGRDVRLPPATATVGGRAVPGVAAVVVDVRPRVPAAVVADERPVFERPERLPAATTRFSPSATTVALVIVGALLAIVGVGTVLTGFVRSRDRRQPGFPGDPVTRAIRLLRESTARPASARRRAASLASRVVGDEALAREAARVAWSPPEPAPLEADALADELERRVGAV